MLDDLAFDFQSLRQAYARGATPQDVAAECFRRIEEAGDPGIFLHLCDRDAVLAEAAALGAYDPAKPLWGIPFAVKDNIDVAGAPTTAACPDFAHVAEKDAETLRLLREAGAILIGKTNLDQFATGLVGVRSPYQPPLNAVDPALVPGGSSSGSAVAVGRGLVAFSLGTDTAGSGRVPAALNNIVGLKPSLGALSATGVVPACRTLDTVSVFAFTVADAYAAFEVMARYDAADSFSRRFLVAPLSAPPAQAVLGVPNPESLEFFGDDAAAQSFADSLRRLEKLGARLVPMDFGPFFAVAEMLYNGTWVAERHSVVQDLIEKNPDSLLAVTRTIINAAQKFSATEAFRDRYRLMELRRKIEPMLEGLDGLVVPTIPTFCTLDQIAADPFGPNARLGLYTNFVNLLDMCGIAVPTAPRPDGRPGSITLLSGAGRDGFVAGWAHQLQHDCRAALGATGWALPQAAPLPAAAHSGELALAVVGAHMSGLPLNKELTALGGRFIKAARTAPLYRLHRLAGPAPVRPGLVRNSADGAAIELEVWALPLDKIGAFLRGIPAPLGLGTLTLDDGETVKGFICEAYAIADSLDVSAFGGWRAYLKSLPND